MNPRHPLLTLLIGSTTLLSACLTMPPSGSAQDDKKQAANSGKAIVWKIEGNDDTPTIYLAGSVHLLREKDFPIPPSYDHAYADSAKAVFEIDMADMLDPGVALKMQRLGSYQNGDTLADHVSKKTVKRLRKYLQKRSLPEAAFMTMKPGLLSMVLSSFEAASQGARPDLGLEMIYGTRATTDKKPTAGLETIEFQIGLFDQFTDEESNELLLSTLDSIDEIGESLDKLIAAWSKGDFQKLDNLLNDEFEENEKLRDALLVQRNKNWIPDIEKAIKGKINVMFMVGAGHLVGKDSVIELLRAKGHKPVQMTYDPAETATEGQETKEQKEAPAPPLKKAA